VGFEPTGLSAFRFQDGCFCPLSHLSVEPQAGVEPAALLYKRSMFPLHHRGLSGRSGIRTHKAVTPTRFRNELTLLCWPFLGGGGGIRTTRPSAYEADELPLLYPARVPAQGIEPRPLPYEGSVLPLDHAGLWSLCGESNPDLFRTKEALSH
jgi:hypothetical protein